MKQFTPFNWSLNQFSYCFPWNCNFKCKSWTYSVILLSFFTVEAWGNEHDYFFDIAIDEYSNPVENLSCKDTIVVVITDGDCSMVEIDMILENSPIGSNENLIFDIELYGDQVCCDAVDLVLDVIVEDTITGDNCMGKVYTTDAVAPTCESVADYTILCGEALPSVDDSSHPEYPQFSDNCGIDNVFLTSQISSGDICNDGLSIIRVWAATDNQGNLSSSDCVQEIFVEREEPVFPESLNFSCSQYTAEDMTPDITGWPTGLEVGCFLTAHYSDVMFLGCDGAELIHRTWSILDMCTNSIITDSQLIDLSDEDAPSIDTAPMTLATAPDQCFFTGFIEAPEVSDECSGLESVEMYIVGVTDLSYVYDNSGFIIGINVEGDGMEVGTHILSITATDQCGNMRMKEVELTVEDNIAPTMVCAENISIVLTELNGSVQSVINIGDIVIEAVDCSSDLVFSFSEDMTVTELAFTCQDLGDQGIEAWVSDASELSATCNVTLSVEDPNNLCDLTSAKELEVLANNTLYQNVPNPVSGSTSIGFELSETTSAKLSIVDINGVLIKQISGVFDEGYNSLLIEDLHAKGLLFYTLETKTFTATKKMLVIN